MPKRIPIEAAKAVAKGHDCRQVIILAWDGELTHVVTYGKTVNDCAQAAEGGNMLKAKLGWPKCNDQPSRVVKLQKESMKEFANEVCRDIPEGWLLMLQMENGAGYFTLDHPEGYRIDPEDYTSVDHDIMRQGRDALAYAIEQSKGMTNG